MRRAGRVARIRGIGRVCRIFSRRLYRALGAEDIRHRRAASGAVLMRRRLSLDYVLEHPDLPWLPTEPEKVAAFEALGIERAVFVYADPGHDTSTALRSWADAHGGLWNALTERGCSVEAVAVVRTPE